MSIYSIKYKSNLDTSSTATLGLYIASTLLSFAVAYFAAVYF